MNFKWKQTSTTNHVFYDEEDGKIYGRVLSALGNSSHNAFFNNLPLGEYVTLEQAMRAVENPENHKTHQTLIDQLSTGGSVRP